MHPSHSVTPAPAASGSMPSEAAESSGRERERERETRLAHQKERIQMGGTEIEGRASLDVALLNNLIDEHVAMRSAQYCHIPSNWQDVCLDHERRWRPKGLGPHTALCCALRVRRTCPILHSCLITMRKWSPTPPLPCPLMVPSTNVWLGSLACAWFLPWSVS